MATNNTINSSVLGSGLPAFTFCEIPSDTAALLIATTATDYISTSSVVGSYLWNLINASQVLSPDATLVFTLNVGFDLGSIPLTTENVSCSIGTDIVGGAVFPTQTKLCSVPLAMVQPNVSGMTIAVRIADIADIDNSYFKFFFTNNTSGNIGLINFSNFVQVMYLPTGYNI
jgi:hypothetical protein